MQSWESRAPATTPRGSEPAPNNREIRDVELLERIRKIHEDSRWTYGSPRVHRQLLRDGVEVGKERVASLMRADGLRGRVRHRFKTTTDSRHDKPIAPNTLNREFTATSSDSVWCAHITYVPTATGWVYLAAITLREFVLTISMADSIGLVVMSVLRRVPVMPKRCTVSVSSKASVKLAVADSEIEDSQRWTLLSSAFASA